MTEQDDAGQPIVPAATGPAGAVTGGVAGCGVVSSEFADVEVAIDATANGPRLRLSDRRTGQVRFLDALELEAIVWLPDGHLTRLLDPSADRWRDLPDQPGQG
jgi:hypothetical protein